MFCPLIFMVSLCSKCDYPHLTALETEASSGAKELPLWSRGSLVAQGIMLLCHPTSTFRLHQERKAGDEGRHEKYQD